MSIHLYMHVPATLRAAPNAAAFAAACNALKNQFSDWANEWDDEDNLWEQELKELTKAAALASGPDGERLFPALVEKLAKDWDLELTLPVAYFEAQPNVPPVYVDALTSLGNHTIEPYRSVSGLVEVGKRLQVALDLCPGDDGLKAALRQVQELEVEAHMGDDERLDDKVLRPVRRAVSAALETTLNAVAVSVMRRALDRAGLDAQ